MTRATTVIRGGSGVLFSPIMLALIQNNVADPLIGAATTYNRTELAARNLKWGNYADEIQAAVRRDRGGQKAIYSLIDPDLRAPYTVQSMINIQRSLGNAWMVEAGYLRTDGRNFPLSRPLANAFDRQTGVRPNPALGTPSGVYLTSEQTMVYNALQTSVRRRFADDLGLGVPLHLQPRLCRAGRLAGVELRQQRLLRHPGLLRSVLRSQSALAGSAQPDRGGRDLPAAVVLERQLAVARCWRLADLRHRLRPQRRAAARDAALGHQPKPAGSDWRRPGARQLPRHAAVPGSQPVRAGADVSRSPQRRCAPGPPIPVRFVDPAAGR